MTFAVSVRRAGPWLAVPPNAANALRALVTLVCATLAVLDHTRSGALVWLVLIVVAAATSAFAAPAASRTGEALRIVEALVAALGILSTRGSSSPLFPYLLAPALAGGLATGAGGAIVPTGLGCAALLLGHEFGGVSGSFGVFAATTTEWVMLALAVGLLGAWVRRLASSQRTADDDSYASAYRLLTELRTVTRRLPGGLDPVGIGQAMLASIRAACRYDRAAVFTRGDGGRLIPLTIDGTSGIDWNIDVSPETAFGEAWTTQHPVVRNRLHVRAGEDGGGRPGSSVVIPLHIGVRTFGLVAFETTEQGAYSGDVVEAARHVAGASALRLETATLFDEVRHLATAEERQRLAREIHDGIAQELVYLGYVLDSLSGDATGADAAVQGQLRELRGEVTRIISELRHSIFDLRTEVDRSGGLGAALSRYVRSVGTTSGLTVHLSLSESALRLGVEAESGILRIAQEAIANARKQRDVANIWVTLEVDPPAARLVVADDGNGSLGRRKDDNVELELMHERAEQLRGKLLVVPRQPRGTCVELTLGVVPVATA